MIDELSIRDLGVIADATLPLGPGFTAVTGETGAGKTMVVTALGLLLGSRADAGAVRSGQPQAWVEGRWIVAEDGAVAERVVEAGGQLDGPELLLGRSVSAEGRSRAVVGGRSAPIGVLAELGEQLVVVHGQSEQVRLRSATAQRDALDRFAGPDLARALGEYRVVFDRWRATADELERLTTARDQRAREARDLRSALDEIEAVDPQPGEDDELQARAERLSNLEELRSAAAQAHDLLSSETADGAMDAVALVETARRQIERAVAHDAVLSPINDGLANVGFLLADLATELSGYLAGLDADGARELEVVQERRAVLSALIRQHGTSLDDVLALRENGGLRLLDLDGDADRVVELEALLASDTEQIGELRARVTALREAAAVELEIRVTDELTALAMPDARLTVRVEPLDEPSSHGGDAVTLLLSPHPGAEPRPIGRGASGGELSRVMLALEVVIAATDPVPTFVFDEVDAGVGGAAAIEIGRRLAKLAESSQVIVVTHLAQVAAFARNHLSVVKGTDGSVTESSVQQLTGDARIGEMARLLSGLSDSDNALAHARELLDVAARPTPA